MKCPSCGYIAFQATEDCVKCGAPVPPGDPGEDTVDDRDFRRSVRREKGQLGFGFEAPDDHPAEDDDGSVPEGFSFRNIDDVTLSATVAGATTTGSLTGPTVGAAPRGDESSFSSGTHWVGEDESAQDNTWIEVYRLASGFGRRAGAMLVDTLFFAVLFALLMLVVAGREGASLPLTHPSFVPAYLFLLVLHAFYFTFFHAATGQTPGKLLFRIRVVSARGGYLLNPWDAFIRWLGYFVSGIPAGLGFLWSLLDHDDRGWHDRWARSVVVLVDSMRTEATDGGGSGPESTDGTAPAASTIG